MEIGSGIGLFSSAFLQVKKTARCILIDIPPALFMAQNYLEASGYKTLGYKDVINLKNFNDIDINKYQAICLPSWKIDLLNNNKFDLLINTGSFQEMEPEIVENYLKKIAPQINKYIYLQNAKQGHAVGKKGEFGVLKNTTRDHYIDFLKNSFEIKVERDYEDIWGENELAFEIIFNKK